MVVRRRFDMKFNKKICADILLCVTFGIFLFPYIGGVYYSIVGMKSGFYHEGHMIYGIESFLDQFFWDSFFLIILGVIPLCMAYNIWFFIKNRKNLSVFNEIILIANSVLSISEFGFVAYEFISEIIK